MRLEPAAAGSGVVFAPANGSVPTELPAHVDHVVDTRWSTTLGKDGFTVRTVEHLLAGLFAFGVDNVRVVVDGPEIPILDGSAGGFADRIAEVGVVELAAPRRLLVVRGPVAVKDGPRWARLEPAGAFMLACTVDFPHPMVRAQHFELELTRASFVREVAWARTFGFSRDVDRLRAAGFALGGSYRNALVFDEVGIASEGGARFSDEPVRHKVLDAIGDLSLVGAPLCARYVGYKSGHALNVRLVRRLLADRRRFGWVTGGSSEQAAGPDHPLAGLTFRACRTD